MVHWHLLIKRDVKNQGLDIKFNLDQNLIAKGDIDEFLIQRGDQLYSLNGVDLRRKTLEDGQNATKRDLKMTSMFLVL